MRIYNIPENVRTIIIEDYDKESRIYALIPVMKKTNLGDSKIAYKKVEIKESKR